MESVTSSSSLKKNQQTEPAALTWFASGPAAVLLFLVVTLVVSEALYVVLPARYSKDSAPAAEMTSLPHAGAALLWFRPVDINSASMEELDLIPGVGEKGAARLLNFRMQRGFLLTVRELRQMSGPFGSRRYEYLESYLSAGPCNGRVQ